MLRLDATAKNNYDGKLFEFKKFSIKEAFFINETFSSHVKSVYTKRVEVLFHCLFKVFARFSAFFKLLILLFENVLKISNFEKNSKTSKDL